MKVIMIFIHVVLVYSFSYAQIDTKPIDFDNRIEPLLDREISVNSLSQKINYISVIDARDDTSEIGYYSTSRGKILTPGLKPAFGSNTKNNWPKVYCIPFLIDSINNWINNYFQCKKNGISKNSLLVVVKKLWLSEEAAPTLFENGKRGQPMDGWDPGVICKFEFYLEKDSLFYPLYRVDSIFTFKDKLPNNAGTFITNALKSSFDNLASINFTNVPAKRSFSFPDIVKEYAKRKDLPILMNTSLKKGVYKNFEEFKTNSPSIQNYEFKKSQMGDLLYVKENDSEYNIRTAWGFCDGLNVYINSSDKYSKLLQRQNTFYFSGIKGISRKAVHDVPYNSMFNLATNTGRKKTAYKGVIKYYQIDMETGEVY